MPIVNEPGEDPIVVPVVQPPPPPVTEPEPVPEPPEETPVTEPEPVVEPPQRILDKLDAMEEAAQIDQGLPVDTPPPEVVEQPETATPTTPATTPGVEQVLVESTTPAQADAKEAAILAKLQAQEDLSPEKRKAVAIPAGGYQTIPAVQITGQPPVPININALANATGLKPSQILNTDGTLNGSALADKLGGKPSDYKTSTDIYNVLRDKKSWGEDLLKEIFSFGQAVTPTYNTDDLMAEYQRAEYEAAQDGMVLTETQDEFIDKAFRNQPSLGQTVVNMVIAATPIVGTVAYWDDMDTKGRALSVGLDVITFLPFAGIIAAGTRAGKTIGTATMHGVVAEIKAPFTMITKPIQTLKTAWGTVETAIFPKTVPISAAEASFHTVKIPVAKVGSRELAMELRDNIMYNSARGEKATATIKKVTATVPEKPAAILKPAIWSGTPDVRPFLEGGVVGVVPDAWKSIPAVARGEGRPLYVSNALHTRFSLATSGGVEAAAKAKPGALLIRDAEVLRKIKPSGQIYQGTAEVEAIIKQGVRLPKPSQTLYMRLPSGDKLTILVIGKPLTKLELTHLKILGHANLIRDIIRPMTKASIKKAGGSFDELVSLKKKARTARVRARANPTSTALREAADVAEANARRFAKKLETNPGLLSYAEVIGTYSRATSVLKSVNAGRPPKKGRARVNPEGRRYVPTNVRVAAIDGRRPPKDGRRRPPTDRRTPPDGRRTPPDDRRTPPDERRTPPDDERTPPDDRRTPPPDDRVIPPDDRVIPPDDRVIPPDDRTPPPDVPRPPVGERKPVTPLVIPLSPKWKTLKQFIGKRGATALRMGMLGSLSKWIVVREPYKNNSDAIIYLSEDPPQGVKTVKPGERSGYKSIQQIKGKAPNYLTLDEGAMDIIIRSPSGKGSPTVIYKPDPKQKTKSHINLKHAKVVKMKGIGTRR